ncbi:MFS transporter [bacterium CPR1]|nr:MFS transporter [bacterium CPR1]
MTTLAFTVCFAVWMMYGVLITFLVDRGLYHWDRVKLGWLIGIPVLTGALMRLPAGLLADRYGGRLILTLLMLVSALPTYLVSLANGFGEFLVAGLGFGLCGASFAVGVAYASLWFPPKRQGMALGLFGMGNLGAALTSMGAPSLLGVLTAESLEGWRSLPRLYALLLALTAVLFWLLTDTRKIDRPRSLAECVAPLSNLRVWRFGLYYFFVFGGFVAVSQWLIPYYVTMYGLSITTAGMLAATFSLPASLIRSVGGALADRFGPRMIMYYTLGGSLALLLLLFPPRMEIQTPGQAVTATGAGTVTEVTADEIVVDKTRYPLARASKGQTRIRVGADEVDGHVEGMFFFPVTVIEHEPLVKVGDKVTRKQALARGSTRLYFQANVWVFSVLVFFLGLLFGCAGAAIYRHIPDYFPGNVGVVGGLVGVLGGIGGFVYPIIFGYLLGASGIWTSCWMFLFAVGLVCLLWMHIVIQRMMQRRVPLLMREIESRPVVTCVRCEATAEVKVRVEDGKLKLERCSLLEPGSDCPAECLEGRRLRPIPRQDPAE